ncbi:class I SAM-dependent methyltransferase [Candidatus Woesearchaeota archaeon]|nr:class I SAM-dependent methyltransferase [Candidatus Woesearchaeota archaeon]
MNEHYFTEKPTSSYALKTVKARILNHDFMFSTVSGVFSFGRIDAGSLLLVENAIMKESWDVLDIGCGWGFVGIAIKRRFPNSNITMVDINERAVKIAKQNAKLNKIEATILQSDLFSAIPQQFDTILVNPPMKAGRELCYQIIEQSKSHLNNDGLLQLVALHNRGGSMLEKKMEEVFGNVKTSAKKGGFRVYVSVKFL